MYIHTGGQSKTSAASPILSCGQQPRLAVQSSAAIFSSIVSYSSKAAARILALNVQRRSRSRPRSRRGEVQGGHRWRKRRDGHRRQQCPAPPPVLCEELLLGPRPARPCLWGTPRSPHQASPLASARSISCRFGRERPPPLRSASSSLADHQ